MTGPRGKAKWPRRAWGLSNFGNLWGVYPTRRAAIEAAVENIGEPWSKCRASMEVWPCTVKPVRK